MIKIYQIPNITLEEMHSSPKNSQFIIKLFFGSYVPPINQFKELYEKAWEGDVGTVDLEDIFYKFNMDRPKDYEGRSLSCGDVVETPTGKYVCRTCGWQKLEY